MLVANYKQPALVTVIHKFYVILLLNICAWFCMCVNIWGTRLKQNKTSAIFLIVFIEIFIITRLNWLQMHLNIVQIKLRMYTKQRQSQ